MPNIPPERHDFVIKQIASSLNPDLGAREYIVNGIENYIEGHVARINVHVEFNRKKGRMTVLDDGIGMSCEQLNRIGGKVADSLKRFDEKSIGEKGLGTVSFLGMGDNTSLTMYSRDKNTPKGYLNLFHWLHDKGWTEATQFCEDKRSLQLGDYKTGTKVIIDGISEENFTRYLTARKFRPKLVEMFHPLIKSGNINLFLSYVGDKITTEKIKPLEFTGNKILDEQITLRYFNVEAGRDQDGSALVRIWFDPSNLKGRVRFYNKGVLVHSNLTEIEQFNKMPWKSGRLDGFINEEYLKLMPSRSAYNQTYRSYFEFINHIDNTHTSNLEKKVKSGTAAFENKELLTLGKKIMRGLNDIY